MSPHDQVDGGWGFPSQEAIIFYRGKTRELLRDASLGMAAERQAGVSFGSQDIMLLAFLQAVRSYLKQENAVFYSS
jgi:hypothetical protein